MTCREFWSCGAGPSGPPSPLGAAQMEHLNDCPACATLMERQQALAAGLRSLAQNRAAIEAPPRVEEQLLIAFRNHAAGVAAPPPKRSWLLSWKWVPVAAAAALAVLLVRNSRPRPVDAPQQSASLEADGFFRLPYAVDSSDDGDLVRVQVPRSTLIALGVPLPEGGGEPVEAEVLLSAGGAPEAVRLLQ